MFSLTTSFALSGRAFLSNSFDSSSRFFRVLYFIVLSSTTEVRQEGQLTERNVSGDLSLDGTLIATVCEFQ